MFDPTNTNNLHNRIKKRLSLFAKFFGLLVAIAVASIMIARIQHETNATYSYSTKYNSKTNILACNSTRKQIFTLHNLYTRLGICFN